MIMKISLEMKKVMNNSKGIHKEHSNIDFKGMAILFRIRDLFKSPQIKVEKAEIQQGDYILDYGCGPGSYTISAAEKVGPTGKVYAADIHPLAIKQVKKKALKKGLNNIEPILTDCYTGLEKNTIDKLICFDVMHGIEDKYNLLREFYRVLKPNSLFSFDDHHMNENEIVSLITESKLFELKEKKENLYTFIKLGNLS